MADEWQRSLRPFFQVVRGYYSGSPCTAGLEPGHRPLDEACDEVIEFARTAISPLFSEPMMKG